MLRFPPRLSWDLSRVRIAQRLVGSARRPLALRIDLADFPPKTEESSGSATSDKASLPISYTECQVLALARKTASPVIWIGGEVPSSYPGIGQLTREIGDLGRTVFVEVSGSMLRRRIHEFRPVSPLYLVLPLHGLEKTHDARVGRKGDFRATLESIRTARLSGFHICVLTTIFADSNFSELHEVPELISKLKVDGWIQAPPLHASPASRQSLEAARDLIVDRRWRMFSKLLAASAPHVASARLVSEAAAEQRATYEHVSVNSSRSSQTAAHQTKTLPQQVPEPASTSDEGLPAL
jgi:hypothetical protein